VIASYLASYNPPASDKRFFSKRKHRKSKKRIKLETNQRSLGPRPYPLERMMAIFHSITTQHVLPTQLVYCQITTLVDFKFIVKVGASHKLDTVKYKCLVTFEAIKELSKSVDFEIVRYLQDYN
jgi:origin recognition complex subunit 5